jgi:coenzyme F420-dependent glucose-6-phosphate dehydrogenase
MAIRVGYKASAEQFGPQELLDHSLYAERLGFDTIAVSDHFQPWRHNDGHAPSAPVWLGALAHASERALLGTSVLTPTMRYQPAVVAQFFATLGCLAEGRVFLGVGTGEAMNELPATGADWPGVKERRRRLAEAVQLIRRLWTEERVDFDGRWYRTRKATIYDRPRTPVPIFIAASGPLAAKLAGRAGDGFICTSGKDPDLYGRLLEAMEVGAREAGRDPGAITRMIEVKVSYDPEPEVALESCKPWAALALSPDEKAGVEDPIEMERLADALTPERASSRFIVSEDPAEVVEKIAVYVELGFTELVLHHPGSDQRRALELFARDVLPLLRERFN